MIRRFIHEIFTLREPALSVERVPSSWSRVIYMCSQFVFRVSPSCEAGDKEVLALGVVFGRDGDPTFIRGFVGMSSLRGECFSYGMHVFLRGWVGPGAQHEQHERLSLPLRT